MDETAVVVVNNGCPVVYILELWLREGRRDLVVRIQAAEGC